MNTIDAIINRRSIRKFINEKIEDEIIIKIINAAMYAPSARNYQPWFFIVIDERHILNAICAFHPYAQMLKDAPLAILVCGDTKIEPSKEYIALNCAAATQNILLSSFELGLGSVWIAIYPREARINETKRILNLPAEILPISLIAIGKPGENKSTPQRFKGNRIYRNKWGEKFLCESN